MGWASASAFNNGDPASLVIGQPDFYSFRCDDGTAGGDVNGTGADSLCGPEGIAVDSVGNLYVADTIDNRVLEFNRPFLSGVTNGQPAAMVFGQHGSLVASGCDDGTALADVGGVGTDSLCDPRAVALDAAGNLYVADSGASRVLEYNTPLNASSGESGAGDALADKVFGQSDNFTTKICNNGKAGGDVSGRGPDSLCGPTGVTADPTGNLYVSDTNNSRILEYNTPLNPSSGELCAGDTTADNVFGQNGSFTTTGSTTAPPPATSPGWGPTVFPIRKASRRIASAISTPPMPATAASWSTIRRSTAAAAKAAPATPWPTRCLARAAASLRRCATALTADCWPASAS